jgi:DNA-binding transcriptional regulator YiaG
VKKKGRKKRRKLETELPQQLRAWRKRRKLSQATAAIELGMPKRTLQEWEQGRATPRGLALVALKQKI